MKTIQNHKMSAEAESLSAALRTWSAPNHAGRINALNQYCTRRGQKIVCGMDADTPREILDAACVAAVSAGY